jgi:hypothetical protein
VEPPIGSARRSSIASGTWRSRSTTTAGTAPLPSQGEVIGAVNTLPVRRTSWSARRAACPATCTSSGGPATQGVPPRIRLLLHGLRGRGRGGREDGGARARRVRHGGRRVVAHDVVRSRHRLQEGVKITVVLIDNGGSGRSATSRPRWDRTPSAPSTAIAGRTASSRGSHSRGLHGQRAQPGRARHRLPDHRGPARRSRGGAGADPGHRPHHRDRSLRGRARLRIVVGRAPGGSLRDGQGQGVRRAYEEAVKKERWFL